MLRSLSIHAVALLAALGALASGCGDDRRAAGGFRVIGGRDATTGGPDASESESRDAGFGGDVGEGRFDASSEGWPDAEAPWDGGFEGFDVGWPDVGFPEFPDATVPDSGFRRDASVPDSGPRDSGFPPFDAGSSSGDAGPTVQTNVVLSGTGSNLVLNLQPPVAANPLTYSTTLQYDNSGPGSQTISVVSAEASIVIISQTFQMGPAHTAPVGQSTRTISKIPGSGSGGDFTLASIACGFPAIVNITLSNGLVLSDFATITCVQ